MKELGRAASGGYAIGVVYLYEPYVATVEETLLREDAVEAELARYKAAHKSAQEELLDIQAKLQTENPEQAKIFEAHSDILNDVVMKEEVESCITSGRLNPGWAVDTVYTQYAQVLKETGNELIAERAADMLDVRSRLLRRLDGVDEKTLSRLNQNVVVVARDLLPSDTATLDRQHVLAIVTEVGGVTSHSAIIAKSYGIPAVLGVANITALLADGQQVIVDAVEGAVLTQPREDELEHYRQLQQHFLQNAEDERRYLHTQCATRDGQRVQILANIGAAKEEELSCSRFVDGVGLFRTEFLYMEQNTVPDEETQLAHYRKVLEAFAPNPVTLRTLDIGGDKEVESLHLPKEDNSFLGNRAIRLCFSREEIFMTQLRAALRASVYGKLKIMFPMISSIEDIRRAKGYVQQAKEALTQEGFSWSESVEIGVMIEIPAVAIMADLVAEEVDFVSIGTNDLTQYTLAVDRVNPAVSAYYQSEDPAVMRLLAYVIQQMQKAGKGVSVCGEMGGDPAGVVALVGMGIRTLSMGASSVARIKKLVETMDLQRAEALAKTILHQKTAKEIHTLLDGFAQEYLY